MVLETFTPYFPNEIFNHKNIVLLAKDESS